MVNTISIDNIEHIICMTESDDPKCFTVEPQTSMCSITLRQFTNTSLEKIKVTHFPLNSNISTTGHKLQGSTLDSLVVNSWTRKVVHWSYVVISRVKRLNSLVLNEKLDNNRSYHANDQLVRWERVMKEVIEKNI